jgi:hypothetical protein
VNCGKDDDEKKILKHKKYTHTHTFCQVKRIKDNNNDIEKYEKTTRAPSH